MATSSNLILNIVEFILAFGLLIFLHELGHFVTARLFKIEVEEFGFGYPPRLVKMFNFGGTEITLNWIPIGGFVRLKGENDPEVPGGFWGANPYARLAVLVGGPLMNLLTGIIIFSLVFIQTGAPDPHKVQIVGVNEGSPAAMAGIKMDDILVSVNGQPIDSVEKVTALVKQNLGKQITIVYLRDGQEITTSATPRLNPPKGEGSLGVVMSNPVVPISFWQAFPIASRVTYQQAMQLLQLPGQLIRGQVSMEEARPVGPKGIYDIYSQAREMDNEIESTASSGAESLPAVNTLWIMGIISVAIGLTNLMPIPPLDGGRILFILPEIIIKRRVPAQYENMVHLIGFALMMALMVYITTQDIINPIVLPK